MRQVMTKGSIFYLQKEEWESITDYTYKFNSVLHERELKRIPFIHQSPQISHRPLLIEYLKGVCSEKRLSHCCLHLSVYLLDIFMDNHSILPERILLVTNVCLLIAAKFEENNLSTPRICELNNAIKNIFEIQEYKVLEIDILNFFYWYIMYPTAAHYAFYYIPLIISKEEIRNTEISVHSIFYNLNQCVSGYLDQVVSNIHYMHCFNPSHVAAVIIAKSRLQNGLSSWSKELEILTSFKREQIEMLMLKINFSSSFKNCQKCEDNR